MDFDSLWEPHPDDFVKPGEDAFFPGCSTIIKEEDKPEPVGGSFWWHIDKYGFLRDKILEKDYNYITKELLKGGYIVRNLGQIIRDELKQLNDDDIKAIIHHPMVSSQNINRLFYFITEFGLNNFVILLLKDERITPEMFSQGFVNAVGCGYIKVAKKLLRDSRSDLMFWDKRLISYAIYNRNGNADIVKLLLQHPKIDPNVELEETILGHNITRMTRPLYEAIEKGDKEIVKYFLEHPKIDIFADDNRALKTALKRKEIVIAKMIRQLMISKS